MLADLKLGPACSRVFIDTRVHERIENKQVAPLRQRSQERKICDVPAPKKRAASAPKN